jgi:hypothetical protein
MPDEERGHINLEENTDYNEIKERIEKSAEGLPSFEEVKEDARALKEEISRLQGNKYTGQESQRKHPAIIVLTALLTGVPVRISPDLTYKLKTDTSLETIIHSDTLGDTTLDNCEADLVEFIKMCKELSGEALDKIALETEQKVTAQEAIGCACEEKAEVKV